MSTNVFSGARAIFRIGGQKVAYASGCDGSEEVMHEPADVMDNLEVQEYVPVGYRVTFNCAIFRTVPGTPGARVPSNTSDPGQGMYGSPKAMGVFPGINRPEDILLKAPLHCTIEDRLTHKVIMDLMEVKCANNNWSVTARGLVGTNLAFNAIRMHDESGT